MRQVTLIALYGEKLPALADLITECQTRIAAIPGLDFQPYDLRQVHGTLLGFVKVPGSPLHNGNFATYRDRLVAMDIPGFLSWIQHSGYFPHQLQIGGFQPRDYPFTSRGQSPYERSFSLQGNKAVMMGWAIRGVPRSSPPMSPLELIQESRLYPPTLDQLRQSAQSFNILHTYHRSLTDVDNDFYFRIGLFDPVTLTPTIQKHLETDLRQFLGQRDPLIVDIGLDNLCIAAYTDETLPYDSTQTWPLPTSQWSQEWIASLYDTSPI